MGVASQVGFISRMNRWIEKTFLFAGAIQESKKLIQWFLGGCDQKWLWHLVHET